MGGQQVLCGPRRATRGADLDQEALRVSRRYGRAAELSLSASKFVLHVFFFPLFFIFLFFITYPIRFPQNKFLVDVCCDPKVFY